MKTHWNYPHEPATKYGEVYTACGAYVPLRAIRYQESEITCEKCKQAMIEFELPIEIE